MRFRLAPVAAVAAMAEIGTHVWVEIRAQKCEAHVVPTPFYKRPKKAAQPQAATTA